jgi:rare lipoprotein A
MITVFKSSLATLYGPGFYGNQTACGERLRRATIGVASRTLKCGTPVAVDWNGQAIVVPVIDRGPFANGANWDLTMATAKALGITGTATIGTVALPAGTTQVATT